LQYIIQMFDVKLSNSTEKFANNSLKNNH